MKPVIVVCQFVFAAFMIAPASHMPINREGKPLIGVGPDTPNILQIQNLDGFKMAKPYELFKNPNTYLHEPTILDTPVYPVFYSGDSSTPMAWAGSPADTGKYGFTGLKFKQMINPKLAAYVVMAVTRSHKQYEIGLIGVKKASDSDINLATLDTSKLWEVYVDDIAIVDNAKVPELYFYSYYKSGENPIH